MMNDPNRPCHRCPRHSCRWFTSVWCPLNSVYTRVVRRGIAVLMVLAFGCATVRVPASALSEPSDAAGVIAPPITELWIESSEDVPRELSVKMDGQARVALEQA